MTLFRQQTFKMLCDTRDCTAQVMVQSFEHESLVLPEGWSVVTNDNGLLPSSRRYMQYTSHYCPNCTKERNNP